MPFSVVWLSCCTNCPVLASDPHKLNNQNTSLYMVSMFKRETKAGRWHTQEAKCQLNKWVCHIKQVLSTQSWPQVYILVVQQKQNDVPSLEFNEFSPFLFILDFWPDLINQGNAFISIVAENLKQKHKAKTQIVTHSKIQFSPSLLYTFSLDN